MLKVSVVEGWNKYSQVIGIHVSLENHLLLKSSYNFN